MGEGSSETHDFRRCRALDKGVHLSLECWQVGWRGARHAAAQLIDVSRPGARDTTPRFGDLKIVDLFVSLVANRARAGADRLDDPGASLVGSRGDTRVRRLALGLLKTWCGGLGAVLTNLRADDASGHASPDRPARAGGVAPLTCFSGAEWRPGSMLGEVQRHAHQNGGLPPPRD
jgi:hypothetical protein